MVKDNCPGSRPKPLSTESYSCNKCGYEIEIFSDEEKIRCPKCKVEISREDIKKGDKNG